MSGATIDDAAHAIKVLGSSERMKTLCRKICRCMQNLTVSTETAVRAMREFGITLETFPRAYDIRIRARVNRHGRMQRQGVPRHRRKRV